MPPPPFDEYVWDVSWLADSFAFTFTGMGLVEGVERVYLYELGTHEVTFLIEL